MNKTPEFIDPVISVERAVSVVGSKARIARFLGLSRGAVTDWGDEVPALHAYRLGQAYPSLADNHPIND